MSWYLSRARIALVAATATARTHNAASVALVEASPANADPTRLTYVAIAVLGAASVLTGCSDTVEVTVANPCDVPIDVVVVNREVDAPGDASDNVDRGTAEVPAHGVAIVGQFADDNRRTLFVEALGVRLVFDDEDLADNESTLVVPAASCPVR